MIVQLWHSNLKGPLAKPFTLLEQELPLPYELSRTFEHIDRHRRLSRRVTGSLAVFKSKLYD